MEKVDHIYSIYSFDEVIAENEFGKVYLGEEIETQTKVVIKESQK